MLLPLVPVAPVFWRQPTGYLLLPLVAMLCLLGCPLMFWAQAVGRTPAQCLGFRDEVLACTSKA